MSKIIATYNLDTNLWKFVDEVSGNRCNLDFAFTRNNISGPIEFQNLHFGFSLYQKDENLTKLQERRYPEYSLYISSDQPVLESTELTLNYETDYKIDFWAINDSTRSDTSYEFSVPRPEAPYESWTWSAETKSWNPPVPRPSDLNSYNWNEDTQTWDLIEG